MDLHDRDEKEAGPVEPSGPVHRLTDWNPSPADLLWNSARHCLSLAPAARRVCSFMSTLITHKWEFRQSEGTSKSVVIALLARG